MTLKLHSFTRIGANCLLFLFLFPVGLSFGQGGASGTITGLVHDSSGASIAGAEVTLTNLETGIKKITNTNAEGYYTFPLLPPGRYQIMVTKQNFRPALTASGVPLDVAQTARVDFSLEVGSVSQQVTVTSQTPLLQTESASLGTVIGQRSVVDLPLNGRNFAQLATLSNGVTANPSPTALGGTQLRSNGMRLSDVLYTIGGASVTEEHDSGITLLPPPDAITEFKLQTNDMSAEYGEGGGTIVNVELKSGTNHFHGNIYEFLRNDALAARNYFAVTEPVLKQNQFGFTLGGPVIRNHTFFFGDYQGTRIHSGVTFNNVVPTDAMKTGDFSALPTPIINPQTQKPFPGNVIPSNQLVSQATFFLPFFPSPNETGETNIRNGTEVNSLNQFDVRADHVITPVDSLDASYSFQQGPQNVPGAFPQVGGEIKQFKSQLANVRETHTFNPNIINEFGYSYFRTSGWTTPQGLGTNYTVESGIAGFNDTSAQYPGFPVLNISGFTTLNGLTYTPLLNKDNMFIPKDSVTLVRGNHTIKTGVLSRFYSFDALNGALSRGDFTFTGTYTGNAFADFLLGLPFQGSRDFPRNPFGAREHEQYFFAQDDWKATPRLTLNLGLRYELHHPMAAKDNLEASFDPYTDQLIVSSDSEGNINETSQEVTQYALPIFENIIVPSSQAGLPPSLHYLHKLNFAPRFGLAWQAWRGFIVRGGYGIFYGQEEGNRAGSAAVSNAPFIVDELTNLNTTPLPTKTLANMFPSLSPTDFKLGPVVFYDLDPHNRTPYYQEWNLTIQKVIAGGISIEVADVGNKGTDVPYSYPLNIPSPGPGPVQARRPFDQRFAAGSYVSNRQNTTYNAFQATARTVSWHKLTMLGGYTYSKSFDYGSDDVSEIATSTVQDPNNVRAERGLSDFDLRQRFSLSAVYDLPLAAHAHGLVHQTLGGWELSNIVTIQSGFPFTPAIATDPANTGNSMRPDRIGSGKLSRPTLSDWFDVAAFPVPALYTYGDSSRNPLTGPGYKDWDLGLFKNVDLGNVREGASAQFRAEFFNFTNTPNFGPPVTNVQAANAGAITTADAAREIQFALKLAF